MAIKEEVDVCDLFGVLYNIDSLDLKKMFRGHQNGLFPMQTTRQY